MPAAAVVAALILLPAPAGAIPAPEARTLAFRLQSEGMRLYKEGKYKEAIEAFRQVVNLNLNSHMAYYYYGVCLAADRRYGEAVEPLKIALDLQPDFLQGHLALGDTYLKLGDTGEARAEFLRALDLQPTYAAAQDGLGRVFESTGQDAEAEEQYRKAIKANVAYVDSYTHLGDLYLRTKRQDEAIELFLKAIAVKPDFSSGYRRLGDAYAQLRLHDDAIAAIGKSQALAPRDPDPHVSLARIYLDLQTLGRAEAALQSALALDPVHAEAHLVLADLKRARQDFDGAVEVLQAVTERSIPDPILRREARARLKTALAAAQRHRPLREAAHRAPEDPAVILPLARFLAEQGAQSAASDLMLRAADRLGTARAPADEVATVRLEAALALMATRHHAAAAAILEPLAASPEVGSAAEAGAGAEAGAAGISESTRLTALFNLGVVRAGLGLDDLAVEAFTAYREARPDDPLGWLYLGNAWLRLGRQEDARGAYAEFLARDATSQAAGQVKRLLAHLGAAGGPEPPPGRPTRLEGVGPGRPQPEGGGLR